MTPDADRHTDTPGKVLFSADDIARVIDELARRIDDDHEGRNEPLVLLGVLTGSVYLLTDLSRRLATPHLIDTIAARSYDGTRSTGRVAITKEPKIDLSGHHVIIVEDIYDTGATIERLIEHIEGFSPASIEVCSLLWKHRPRPREIDIRYIGLEIPNLFVIGYGLDLDEEYRHLPYIAVLDGNGE